MTWTAQVRAIVAKDVRQFWWMHVALVTLILLAAVDLRNAPGSEDLLGGMTTSIIPMLALGIVSMVVRLEPPASGMAFWTTQPIHPSAMAIGKLLHAAGVAVIIIAGATDVLRVQALSAPLRSSLVALMLGVIPAACVATALVTALATSRLAVAAQVGAVWFVWYAVFLRTGSPLPTSVVTSPALLGMLAVAGIAITVAQYRVRPPVAALDTAISTGRKIWSALPTSSALRDSTTRTAKGAPLQWWEEVRRTFVRGLRDTWRTLAIVVALLALLTGAALQGKVLDFGLNMVLDYAVRFALCYHAALIIASDPPPSAKSFWATQPRTPSAVATSTLLQLAVPLLVMLLVAIITHSAWRFDGAERWVALARMLEVGTAMLLPVAVQATMVRDVPRMAFSAAMIGVIYSNPGMDGTRGFLTPISRRLDVLPSWSWVAIAMLATAVLVRSYRTAKVASGWVLLPLLAPYLLLSRATPPAGVPTQAAEALSLSLEATLQPNDPYVWFDIHAPYGLPGDINRLTDYTLTVTHKDGTTTRMRGLGADILERRDGKKAVVHLRGDSLAVIGGAFLNTRDSTSYRDLIRQYFTLRDDRVDDLVSATLDGTLETFSIREVDRLPLRRGLAFLQNGTRGVITITHEGTAPPTFGVHTRWLRATPALRAPWTLPIGMTQSELSFALVNRHDRRMLALTSSSGEYYGVGLPLLGLGVTAYEHVLTPTIWTQPKPPVDSAWLADAELVVGAPQRTSTMRIHLTGPVTYTVEQRRKLAR